MHALVRGSRSAVLLFVLFLCAAPAKTQAQQPFVHSNDVLFTIRTDSKEFNVGDQIVIRYTIKNVSNGTLYVPRSQWEIKCGNPPHFWSRLEDSSGKHYEPGYGFSCLGPSDADRMSVSERMQKDAVLLKPGQQATGSFRVDSNAFANELRPGNYRLEAVIYGWNLAFDNSQLSELAKMEAPFFMGESGASSQVKLLRRRK
jgi:hypothetical protein